MAGRRYGQTRPVKPVPGAAEDAVCTLRPQPVRFRRRRSGIDRSALSQLLSGASTRLPRAETLLNIASENKVSLDWLLGLSQDEGLTGEIRASFEIEEGGGGFDRTLLARWHAEAAGTKIRYVPAGIPDLLRTEALIDYEAGITNKSREAQADETHYRIDY